MKTGSEEESSVSELTGPRVFVFLLLVRVDSVDTGCLFFCSDFPLQDEDDLFSFTRFSSPFLRDS